MVDVGTQINQYRVIEHIGRGGMADVWSARDESLGRMVAVKTIARNLTSDADPIALFEREAKTIANLEHPHILPIFGFGERDGKLYIIMRFVTGGSLEDKLRSGGAMTYEDTITIGRAVADALEYAHTQHIVHLDLKPPNILLDSQGAPYLADFGLATALDPQGRAQNPGSGTLLYMAPEQITSDELDHRVDVYSFSLVIYHMLTGSLPFKGTSPLAIRQIQFQDDLPPLTDLNPDLPDTLTEILRRGTAVDPNARYADAKALIDDITDALGASEQTMNGGVQTTGVQGNASTPFVELVTMVDPAKVQQREAKDIYNRAYAAWANGNGRFLLSVTHFMVMSDYYKRAADIGLSYDRSGAQMLLRGALEYNYHLDYWWQQVDTDGRRWVSIHTIRSENPQARIRALYRLETLPDTDPPRIPKQVAQALSIENDKGAILAALDVLGYRAALLKNGDSYDVQSDYRGQPLDTTDRVEVRQGQAPTWRNVTYSQEIDVLVADLALDGRTADIRRAAARAIGRMRSARAVRHLMDARKHGQRGGLRALAYVLDETPSLPGNIAWTPRVLAWLVNTGRRLTENPMQIVWSFLAAMAGGWLGMGYHIYRTFRSQSFFTPQRLLNTAAGGLFIGVIWAILTILALTLPKRLRDFWPRWTYTLWSAIAAYFMAQSVWWVYGYMYLNLNDTPNFIFTLAGTATALSFVLPVYFRLRGWAAVLITTGLTYAALYVGTANFVRLYIEGAGPLVDFTAINAFFTRAADPSLTEFGYIFAYDAPQQLYTILLPMVILFALGAHLPALVRDVRDLWAWLPMREAADADKPDTIMPAPTLPGNEGTLPLVDREQVMADAGAVADAPTPPASTDTVTDVPAATASQPDDVSQAEQDDTDPWAAIDQQFAELDARTEEFEMDKVGKSDGPTGKQGKDDELSSDPDLQTTVGPRDPSLSTQTEEFETGQVGVEKSDDDEPDETPDDIPDNDEDEDDPWSKIEQQLNDLDT